MDDKIKKFISVQSERVDGFKKIGLPNAGEQIMLVSDESFNALTFLLYIAESGEPIEELVLSFYSFNMKAMEYLDSLLEIGAIKNFIFQTSDLRKYGSDAQIPRKLAAMIKKYGANRVQGSFINSHAKIMLCNANNNYYIIEGSGNMALKVRAEQYLIENSKASYDFHKKWITTNVKREVIKWLFR